MFSRIPHFGDQFSGNCSGWTVWPGAGRRDRKRRLWSRHFWRSSADGTLSTRRCATTTRTRSLPGSRCQFNGLLWPRSLCFWRLVWLAVQDVVRWWRSCYFCSCHNTSCYRSLCTCWIIQSVKPNVNGVRIAETQQAGMRIKAVNGNRNENKILNVSGSTKLINVGPR